MDLHMAPGGPCSRRYFMLVSLVLLLPYTAAFTLPILPIPISFNFGGSSPMTMDVACTWGTQVEVDGAKQVRQSCGAARYAWKAFQESASGSNAEIPLGSIASQPKLTLTLAPPNRQTAPATLQRSGTYLVQLTIQYEKCSSEQGQTRINVGSCPTSNDANAQYELQQCKDVSEPGKRKLTLSMPGQGAKSSSISWQLLPQGSNTAQESGSSQSLTCQPGSTADQCVLYLGSGSGRVQTGRSYMLRYTLQQQQQQQPQQGIGFGLGFGGFGFGFGSGSGGATTATAYKELKLPVVDKCPPRVTRSAAGMMGTCGASRWLEMQASAVDIEEGSAATGLKFYWYVLSARTQDVVMEASGPLVKLDIGTTPGKLPDGRRYLVNLVVISRVGDQTSSTRVPVSGVVDVPAC